MPPPPELLTLIDRFARNREDYTKGRFLQRQIDQTDRQIDRLVYEKSSPD